jgi:hypothetical protein
MSPKKQSQLSGSSDRESAVVVESPVKAIKVNKARRQTTER